MHKKVYALNMPFVEKFLQYGYKKTTPYQSVTDENYEKKMKWKIDENKLKL